MTDIPDRYRNKNNNGEETIIRIFLMRHKIIRWQMKKNERFIKSNKTSIIGLKYDTSYHELLNNIKFAKRYSADI